SEKRVAGNKEFDKVRQSIDRYLTRKDRKTISLNEQKLREEKLEQQKVEDKIKEDKEINEAEDPEDQEGPIIADKPYNNEVLHIGLDYLSLLRGATTAQK